MCARCCTPRRCISRTWPRTALFARRGWRLIESIDRVYSNLRAREALAWQPRRDFGHVLDCLANGRDFRSGLALAVGSKGYHDEVFADGPYRV